MNEELSHQEFIAIEEFAKDLKECFSNKLKDGDEFTRILMNYAIQIIDIHLSLAQIKFERWANNMEKSFGG